MATHARFNNCATCASLDYYFKPMTVPRNPFCSVSRPLGASYRSCDSPKCQPQLGAVFSEKRTVRLLGESQRCLDRSSFPRRLIIHCRFKFATATFRTSITLVLCLHRSSLTNVSIVTDFVEIVATVVTEGEQHGKATRHVVDSAV